MVLDAAFFNCRRRSRTLTRYSLSRTEAKNLNRTRHRSFLLRTDNFSKALTQTLSFRSPRVCHFRHTTIKKYRRLACPYLPLCQFAGRTSAATRRRVAPQAFNRAGLPIGLFRLIRSISPKRLGRFPAPADWYAADLRFRRIFPYCYSISFSSSHAMARGFLSLPMMVFFVSVFLAVTVFFFSLTDKISTSTIDLPLP